MFMCVWCVCVYEETGKREEREGENPFYSDGHLCGFQFGAVVNGSAMNIL